MALMVWDLFMPIDDPARRAVTVNPTGGTTPIVPPGSLGYEYHRIWEVNRIVQDFHRAAMVNA